MASISQSVLPFNVQATSQLITAHSGLILMGEFMHRIGMNQWINLDMPKPGSGRGYQPHCFISPLMLMMMGGGHALEDVRMIAQDAPLCKLLQLKVPSTDAMGDWLRRTSLHGLQQINRRVVSKALSMESRTEHTLDADATQVIAEKHAAKFTYKGEQGYMPIVGHLAESRMVIHAQFREGNVAPADSNLQFIKECEAMMPAGHRIAHIRQDSAAYQAEVFNYCEDTGKTFAIGGRLDGPTMEVIKRISDSAWIKRADCEVAEITHTMGKTKNAFRLIVVRYPYQGDLLDDKPHYQVIASNRKGSTEDILNWYRQRGEVSENGIKELKIGFGLERLPCGQFKANAAFFALGVLAHNLFVLFKQATLDEEWKRCKVATVRWRLFQTAGKLIRHAGKWVLQVGKDAAKLFEQIRARGYALSTL